MTILPPERDRYVYSFQRAEISRREYAAVLVFDLWSLSLYFLPNFPFHPGFSVVALISLMIHLTAVIFFRQITGSRFPFMAAFCYLNIFLMGLGMHYSGGIISPFAFVFVSILTSMIYGVDHPHSIWMACGTYLTIILAEYFNVLGPVSISPQLVYASTATTGFIAFLSLSGMAAAGFTYKFVVRRLRVQLEAEQADKVSIRHKLAELEAPSQLGYVVAKIVHDVRGPLGGIKGLLDLIRNEQPLSREGKEDCAAALHEIGRVNSLLGRMLQYVKPGEAKKEPLDAAEVVETVLAIARFSPEAAGVHFIKGPSIKGGARVLANKEDLQRLIFNVLKNALEALQARCEGREIEVVVQKDSDAALIRVRDNGPGMPQELVRKLTVESISTKSTGSGLGLLIVKELLEACWGKMTIESREGEGTTVTMRIPLADVEGINAKEKQDIHGKN